MSTIAVPAPTASTICVLKRRLISALVTLEEAHVSRATIAAAVGGRLTRQAGAVDRAQVAHVEALARTVGRLSDSLTPVGIETWMTTPNRLLDGATPRDELAAGNHDRVEAAAESFDAGSYV